MNRKNFVEQYTKIVHLAAGFTEIARREGILSLESRLDDIPVDNDRDIFKYGIKFAIDGYATEIIDQLLTNLVNQEKDAKKKVLKILQKEAVLMIQRGFNVNLMLAMLNSYTDISLAEHEAILNAMDTQSLEKEEVVPDELDTGKLQIFTTMPDRAIQMVMRNLDSLALAKALKGEGKLVRNAFFRNMSDRAAAMLKEDMQYIGPMRAEDLAAEQDSILALVEQLKESGEINID